MTKKDVLIIADLPQEVSLSLQELCEICNLSLEAVNELVTYEIIHPAGAQEQWVFDLIQLQRVKRALRLQRDLEMNLASIALVLELLEELEDLRSRAALWERLNITER